MKKNYGVPLGFIDRLEKFSRDCIEWSGERPVIRYMGRVLPVINLESSDEEIICMVIDVEGIKKGVVINNILDVAGYDNRLDKTPFDKSGIIGKAYFNR